MKNRIFSGLAGLFLVGCGASSTLVIEEPRTLSYEPKAMPASFSIRPLDANQVDAQDENIAAFENRLSRKLGAAGLTSLKIEYRFLDGMDDGRLEGWFGSGSGGQKSVTVDVVFLSVAGQRLARIQAEGSAGSLTKAVYRAADEVAGYAIETFGG